MAETLINDYLVTVGGSGISVGVGTITVSNAALVAGGFRILIGAELMLVNSGGLTTTWLVSRGIEGTTTSAHNFGDPIHVVLTATGLTNIMSQYLIQSTGAYSSGTTYSQYQMVYWQGSQYISLQSSNINNQPDTSPTYWGVFSKSILFMGAYSSGTTYAINDSVSYSGTSYVSLVSSNTANQPDTSPTYWQILASKGATGGSSTSTYANPLGFGNRTELITVTATVGWNGATSWFVNTPSNSGYFGGGAISGLNITFDFGFLVTVTEARYNAQYGTAQGTWQWQGSTDNITYYNIGANFTITTAPQLLTTLNGNTTPYRYYRMLGVSGNTNAGPYVYGMHFSILTNLWP